MIAALLAAVLALPLPADATNVASAPTMVLAPAPPSSNPCAHRSFCGPIHLLPSDPVERNTFLFRLALQIVDGVVTQAGLRAGRGSYVPLERIAPCVHPWDPCASLGLGPAHFASHIGPNVAGTYEADPLVAPFAHAGLVGMLAGGLAFDVGAEAATRRWSASSRAMLNVDLATSHLAGIQSWSPLLAARHATDARYASCVAGDTGVAAVNGTPTIVLRASGTSVGGGPSSFAPTNACAGFTSLPVVQVAP